MIRPIIHDPLFLSLPSGKASPEDAPVIRDLKDTLCAHREECVGMAANMIGVRKNIIIVSTGSSAMILVNAAILSGSKPYDAKESCLSLLGGPRPVRRFGEIVVSCLDENFQPKKQRFTGFTAQIIQHELDHVNGVLI